MNPNKNLKVFAPILASILVSFFALAISFLALKEARLANKLEIEPVITVQCPASSKGYELKFIIENEGNIDVKNLVISWAAIRILDKNLKISITGPSSQLSKSFKSNQKLSYLLSLEGHIEFPKTETVTINGKDVYVEKGKIIFLGIKAVYRRVPDSRIYEKIFYFSVNPRASEIFATELKGFMATAFLDIMKELESAFIF